MEVTFGGDCAPEQERTEWSGSFAGALSHLHPEGWSQNHGSFDPGCANGLSGATHA